MTSLYSLAHLHDLPAATWDALVPEGQPFLRHAFLSALEDSGSVAHIHVYVPDVRQSFELARKAGGKAVQEPVRKDDPDLRGGIVDASGTTWWLSTRQE